MDPKETDSLNHKKKSVDEDGVVIVLSTTRLNRNISWKDALKQSLACIIANTLVIQAGVNMAYSAVLLPQLFADDTDLVITMSESTWIASIVTLALPPGSLVVGSLMDKFGRKNICIFTAVPFMFSWILQSQSTEVWHMYLARILAGIGAGLSTVSTVYVSEVTHPNYRPMLLSLNSVFVSLGILITCILGVYCNWRTMALVYCVISIFSFFALFFVPESPHWLWAFKNDLSSAAKSMRWTYTDEKVFEAQFEIFMESRKQMRTPARPGHERNSNYNSKIEDLKNYLATYREPVIYKPLTILFLLFVLQQLSGAYVIIFYAVDFIRKIGGKFQHGIDAFTALVLLGSIRFVMSIITVILSKKIGRRPLLMISGIGMSLTSLMAGFYMYLTTEKEELAKLHIIKDQQEDNVTIICLLGYVCFSAIGFLVIPWTLIGELLPVRVRGVLSGLLVAVAYVFMFAIVKVFPYLLESLNVQVIFFGMCIVNIFAVCFIFFFLPETFGKTFTEIEKYFERR